MRIENVHDYGLRRRGLTMTVWYLKKQMEGVEKIVSNPAQRYKLLKYIVERLLTFDDVQMAILEGEEPRTFVFRFEKGQLITEEEKR